ENTIIASERLTAGGMTRRYLSWNHSWWTPWTKKWNRSPHGALGTQWNSVRCNQYSIRVQATYPPNSSSASTVQPTPSPIRLQARSAATTGNHSAGTTHAGIREKKSTKSLSNILGDSGEALSTGILRRWTR